MGVRRGCERIPTSIARILLRSTKRRVQLTNRGEKSTKQRGEKENALRHSSGAGKAKDPRGNFQVDFLPYDALGEARTRKKER